MITESDGDAATVLWKEVGVAALQRLLELAGMTGTVLGRTGYWGLTEITAADEIRALRLFSPRAIQR